MTTKHQLPLVYPPDAMPTLDDLLCMVDALILKLPVDQRLRELLWIQAELRATESDESAQYIFLMSWIVNAERMETK